VALLEMAAAAGIDVTVFPFIVWGADELRRTLVRHRERSSL